MLYEEIFRGLHGAQIRYLVVGAVAVNLHGVPRMTADLDLMVDFGETNLRSLGATLMGLGYRPRIPVAVEALLDPAQRREWRESKGMAGREQDRSDIEALTRLLRLDEEGGT